MSKVAATKVASKVASKVATASRSFASKVVPSTKVAASLKVTASTSADTKFVTGNLSNSGKFFFGSLCVGTFGLGCWQLDRLYEKLDKIDDREQQLQMTPILYNSKTNTNNSYNNYSGNNDIITSDDDNSSKTKTNPYRRRLLRGVFRHEKEVLIGPRGAPAGVQMPLSGLSAKKAKNNNNTSTAGGMQPGPQGYHILTPMELIHDSNESKKDNIVWINRGWVPKSIVPGANQSHFRNSNTGQIDIIAKTKLTAELKNAPCTWNRPQGLQEMTVIISKPEKPRFITPVHDYTKRPLQLFWVDGLALKAIAEITSEEDVALLVQVLDTNENDNDNDNENTTSSSSSSSSSSNKTATANGALLAYPLQPPVSSISEFKTTPSVHVGYATTWFGLSGAGLYMTKKLITKGRY